MKRTPNIIKRIFKSTGVFSFSLAIGLTLLPFISNPKLPFIEYDLRYKGYKNTLGIVKVSKGFKYYPG